MVSPNSKKTYLFDNLDHILAPVVVSGLLGNKDEIGTSCDTSHKSKVTAVSAHDFNDEGTLVGACSGLNVVDHLANSGKG